MPIKGRPIEYMTLTEAVDFAAGFKLFVSIPTVTKWADKFKFGHQLGGKGGKWVINKTKFQNYIHGKNDD